MPGSGLVVDLSVQQNPQHMERAVEQVRSIPQNPTACCTTNPQPIEQMEFGLYPARSPDWKTLAESFDIDGSFRRPLEHAPPLKSCKNY